MKTIENGEVILSAHEAYYLADMIHQLVKYCNGNDKIDKEGLYIKGETWLTGETCRIMKELLKTQRISHYGLSINTLADLT